MKCRVELRKGHVGVASRDDTSEILEADSLHDAIPEYANKWLTADQDDASILYVFAPDDTSNHGGNWEHYVSIEDVD